MSLPDAVSSQLAALEGQGHTGAVLAGLGKVLGMQTKGWGRPCETAEVV